MNRINFPDASRQGIPDERSNVPAGSLAAPLCLRISRLVNSRRNLDLEISRRNLQSDGENFSFFPFLLFLSLFVTAISSTSALLLFPLLSPVFILYLFLLLLLLECVLSKVSEHHCFQACHTTASLKPSLGDTLGVGYAVVGRVNAGWTTSKRGHPCSRQNCSQWSLAEMSGRGSLLNRPSCLLSDPIGQRTELN